MMTLAITLSRGSLGIEAPIVTVETHISNGLPGLHIVGLPETVVKESKDRVRSAILTSHFKFPSRRITVNLAPADLPKQGGRYDLPIALGILAASDQIPHEHFEQYEFAGELALSGELRPIAGILPLALATKKAGRNLILSKQNAEEAERISDIKLLPAKHLLEVCSHFLEKNFLKLHERKAIQPPPIHYADLKDIRGQYHAKRGLEIAAAGQHSILLVGPPGAGKTMLSNCLPGILPPLEEEEAIEIAAIQSISGNNITMNNWFKRPFRAPHHSASSFALIGGGNPPKPGEISLAHHGVLFLDELPEFKRQALEALREPLESGCISLSRAKVQVQYPAKFQLIAAMNPCPCGQFGNKERDCLCMSDLIKRYQSRISGPLLDRIDMKCSLQPVPTQLLTQPNGLEESSASVAARVVMAREKQIKRIGKPNALLNSQEIEEVCKLDEEEKLLLEKCIEKNKISARSYKKILKLGRTIADLSQATQISSQHLKEALSFHSIESNPSFLE